MRWVHSRFPCDLGRSLSLWFQVYVTVWFLSFKSHTQKRFDRNLLSKVSVPADIKTQTWVRPFHAIEFHNLVTNTCWWWMATWLQLLDLHQVHMILCDFYPRLLAMTWKEGNRFIQISMAWHKLKLFSIDSNHQFSHFHQVPSSLIIFLSPIGDHWQGRNVGARGEHSLGAESWWGHRITKEGAENSQQCRKYFLKYSTFASERPQVRTWGAKLAFCLGRHLTSLRPWSLLIRASSKPIVSPIHHQQSTALFDFARKVSLFTSDMHYNQTKTIQSKCNRK